jgi:hypothetical protein
MIRVERDAEVSPGVWAYRVPSLALCGKSREPLLDACRQIIALVGFTTEDAGIFREGRAEPDMTCPVQKGAEVTVSEPANGKIRFARYRAFAGLEDA